MKHGGNPQRCTFPPASDPVLTLCDLSLRKGLRKNSSHQELGLKEEINSTECKKEKKEEGAKQAKESKSANVLTASRTKAFSDVFPNKPEKDSLAT